METIKRDNIGIGSVTPVAELCIFGNGTYKLTESTNIVIKSEENKIKNDEEIIFDIIAASRSRSQKGDLSEFVKDLLSPQQVSTLRKRDKDKMTGNPIDIKKLIK